MDDTEKELARLLLLEGKGWHDGDGPTTVDSVSLNEGVGYPVKYHWESGGAGADSVAGFLRVNYLPVEETIRIAARLLAAERSRVNEAERQLAELRPFFEACLILQDETPEALAQRLVCENANRREVAEQEAHRLRVALNEAERERDEARELAAATERSVQRLLKECARLERDRDELEVNASVMAEQATEQVSRLTAERDMFASALKLAREAASSVAPFTCHWCGTEVEVPSDAHKCQGVFSYGHKYNLRATLETRDAEVAKLKGLLERLRDFTEYLGDQLNNMDAVEPEDEEREGGILAEVRAVVGPMRECPNCGPHITIKPGDLCGDCGVNVPPKPLAPARAPLADPRLPLRSNAGFIALMRLLFGEHMEAQAADAIERCLFGAPLAGNDEGRDRWPMS